MATMILTGRLGKDAELKSLQSGTEVLAWSMAYDTGYGDKKKSHWVKCALFGKRASALQQHMTKGSLVEVVGEPIASAWKDRESGEARAQIEIAVSEVKLHGGGKDRAVADHTEPQAPKRREAQDDMDDRIPF
jgi:single-strand DNA-binding protein